MGNKSKRGPKSGGRGGPRILTGVEHLQYEVAVKNEQILRLRREILDMRVALNERDKMIVGLRDELITAKDTLLNNDIMANARNNEGILKGLKVNEKKEDVINQNGRFIVVPKGSTQAQDNGQEDPTLGGRLSGEVPPPPSDPTDPPAED